MIKYNFSEEAHALPRVSHRNSNTLTPYKRQPPSTRELLRDAVKTCKPKEACKKVEEQLGGIKNPAGVSAVDLHKTKMSGFIRSLQLLPSPMCVLATDAQLHQLVVNCTNGIMHLDPTFNLGSFFVTPIVIPLIKYLH